MKRKHKCWFCGKIILRKAIKRKVHGRYVWCHKSCYHRTGGGRAY